MVTDLCSLQSSRCGEARTGDGVTLLNELMALRKGRGVNSADIHISSSLRELCGIQPEDTPGHVRRKLIDGLDELAARLPPDLGLAARVALAIQPEAQQRFLTERTEWLAQRIERDNRTARRRMNEALQLMADLDTAGAGTAESAAPPEEHFIAEHWALVRLDQPNRDTHERRVVVSNVDGLREIDTVVMLPQDRGSSPGPPELHMEVLYGATLVRETRETETRFRYRLRLASPLNAGQSHEYSIIYRIPPKQLVRPHYVFIPHLRCNQVTLRVRFPADRLPADVRRIENGYLRDLDGEMTGDPITLDDAGELSLTFTRLLAGMAYGARWQIPSDPSVHR